MAQFNRYSTQDIDKLVVAVQRLPQELKSLMYEYGLERAGAIIKDHMETSILEKGLIDTGQLADSIVAEKHDTYVDVAPYGDRRLKKSRDPKKEPTATRNAEVGFVQEYGAPRRHIPATYWMRDGAEASVDEVEVAVLSLYDEILEHLF